jgi:hypothetical protein
MGMRVWTRSWVLALGMTVTACGGSTQEVTLNAQNNSGRTGKATLSEKADGTLEVSLQLSGGNDTGAQAAHIHEGSCATVLGVTKVLSSVISGSSVTSLPNTLLADVKGRVINVHNSASPDVYVACGEIK